MIRWFLNLIYPIKIKCSYILIPMPPSKYDLTDRDSVLQMMKDTRPEILGEKTIHIRSNMMMEIK